MQEIEPTSISYELLPYNLESQKIISDFTTTESDARKSEDEENRDWLNHCIMLGQIKHVTDLLKTTEYGTDKSFVIIAREGQKVVGVSVDVVYENDGELWEAQSFTGVSWKAKRKGIGVGLTNQRHTQLKKLGITEYYADIWENSKKMLIRAGVNKIEQIDPNDPKSHRIFL